MFFHLKEATILFGSLFILQFTLLLVYAEGTNRAKYGDLCGKSKRCDSSSNLVCRNSTCQCYKPDDMIYDRVVQSCLVLVGEKCRFQLGSEDDSSLLGNWIPPSERRMLQEELDCVERAWCNPAGVCVCSGDYQELGNGTCISRRTIDETCSSDMECRQDRFLSCIGGRCGCNETTSTYNVLLRQCVGKAGSPCLGMDGCVYNAECSTTSIMQSRRRPKYVKTCNCAAGFLPDSDGFCKVGLEGRCSDSQPCASTLKCTDGRCICKFENVQRAQLRTQTCISLVGGPCNETSSEDSYQCVENAYCSLNNATELYECRCRDGFIESIDGTCDLGYGSSCHMKRSFYSLENQDLSYPWDKDIPCDRMTPLYCVDGTCQCQSSLYIFDGSGTCLGKHGARCKKNLDTCPPSSNCMEKEQCIQGAKCTGVRGMDTSYARCLCTEPFNATKNRTCFNVNA